ncbi:hypothetical protein Tco_0235780 [Tanacetum coccineum]
MESMCYAPSEGVTDVVPLRSDTIWLVQNGCSFHELLSEDPNQHLKDFLKLVDSLDLDVANRERTRLRLFQYSLHDQASNWLERLLVGSISTWEDLTTRFFAQLFPSGPYDTQYCMENPEQAFVDYTSSCTDEAGGALISDTVKNPKLNVNSTSPVSSAHSYPTQDPQYFEMDDLTSEAHDLLSSMVILSEDNYRRGCERASDLESGFYMDVDKLGPPYKEEIEGINLDASFEANGSRTSEGGVTYLIVPFQVFSIWKAFGGNTRDLGSFGEEMDKTTERNLTPPKSHEDNAYREERRRRKHKSTLS